MPIYWRNKIYSEEEREKLWLLKLDKQQRFVLGNKIDVSRGNKEYYEALAYAQKKNRDFGYRGNSKEDWNREKYEQTKRLMLQRERGLLQLAEQETKPYKIKPITHKESTPEEYEAKYLDYIEEALEHELKMRAQTPNGGDTWTYYTSTLWGLSAAPTGQTAKGRQEPPPTSYITVIGCDGCPGPLRAAGAVEKKLPT